MAKNIQKIIWFSVGLAFLFSVGLAKPALAGSASLYLSPSSGTYAIGDSFLVEVKVNSSGQAINAAEGNLVFNPDEVEVIKISKNNSIFGFWTSEPSFSNSLGNIVFGGGTPDSFTGNSGTIITITFKSKTIASAQVNFSSGSVLAADGKGTNVLDNIIGGVYTLKAKITIPPSEEVPPESEYIPPATPGGVPFAPVVFSSTHSESNKWYSNNNPEFSWKVPSDVTAVKLLINKIPFSLPVILYGSITEKKIENLEDGAWYFHIRFKNEQGWGGIIHKKVLIDTEPPQPFEIKVDDKGDSTNPSPILHFQTTDSLSGIEYYEVKIGENDAVSITAAAVESNSYKIPAQEPGMHTIIVKAFDMASNSTTATTDIIIEPIELPIITDFSQIIQLGDILTIKGTSQYPEATIKVLIKEEGEETITGDVKTDKEGNWVFVYDKSLDKGTYQVWAKIIDNRGAQSNLTEKITIAVSLPTIIKFGEIAIDYLTVIITLAALIVVLVLIIFYARYQVALWKKRIREETKDVETVLQANFKTLRKKTEKQIEYFNKKPGLTKREREVHDKLKDALKMSEEFIKKEVEDIKKQLKK